MGALTEAQAEIMAVVAQIQQDWTAYPLVVEAENRTAVNQEKQTNPYLQVSLNMLSADQLDLAARPRVVQYGQILLAVLAKDGSGSVQARTLLDFITPYLELKDFTRVRTHAFEVARDTSVRGWTYYPGIINFWYVRESGQ